jgi:hypothetical protein
MPHAVLGKQKGKGKRYISQSNEKETTGKEAAEQDLHSRRLHLSFLGS